eukprot:TRINITY_DN94416_c0_g1_i1.p1 TRINITY_DN94416_c0_g1~~TRINITY_DN94416_c0_g1_i1.p1  ORF type:complete len:604 (-),score=44.22 TRINITY_DN94416_c0_g1_i1:147-1916(-)
MYTVFAVFITVLCTPIHTVPLPSEVWASLKDFATAYSTNTSDVPISRTSSGYHAIIGCHSVAGMLQGQSCPVLSSYSIEAISAAEPIRDKLVDAGTEYLKEIAAGQSPATPILAVYGRYCTGKTWVLCQISGDSLPTGWSQHTMGISARLNYLKEKDLIWMMLDTAGRDMPVEPDSPAVHDKRATDQLALEVVFTTSDIVLVVVGPSITLSDQEYLSAVHAAMKHRFPKQPTSSRLIVLHNFFNFGLEREVEQAIETQIVGFYKARKAGGKGIYKSANFTHIVMAQNGTEAGKKFNAPAVSKIHDMISVLQTDAPPLDGWFTRLKQGFATALAQSYIEVVPPPVDDESDDCEDWWCALIKKGQKAATGARNWVAAFWHGNRLTRGGAVTPDVHSAPTDYDIATGHELAEQLEDAKKIVSEVMWLSVEIEPISKTKTTQTKRYDLSEVRNNGDPAVVQLNRFMSFQNAIIATNDVTGAVSAPMEQVAPSPNERIYLLDLPRVHPDNLRCTWGATKVTIEAVKTPKFEALSPLYGEKPYGPIRKVLEFPWEIDPGLHEGKPCGVLELGELEIRVAKRGTVVSSRDELFGEL